MGFTSASGHLPLPASLQARPGRGRGYQVHGVSEEQFVWTAPAFAQSLRAHLLYVKEVACAIPTCCGTALRDERVG